MRAKDYVPDGTLTNTSIMLGCEEMADQVVNTMEKVRIAGVHVMTFGQYMRPSKRHMPVSTLFTFGCLYVVLLLFKFYRGEKNGHV